MRYNFKTLDGLLGKEVVFIYTDFKDFLKSKTKKGIIIGTTYKRSYATIPPKAKVTVAIQSGSELFVRDFEDVILVKEYE